MINKPMIVVAALVVLAGAGIAYYFHSHNAPSARLPAPSAPQSSAPSEPAIEHPVPSAPSAASAPLPALGDSDPAIRDALAAALGKDAMRYLVPESLVRHIVVTIDNLPREKVSAAKRPTVAVPGAFLAEGDELHATIDPRNYARYDAMMSVVRKLDMKQVADVYLRFYPLFQGAYQDLGYPTGYFNDRLVQVIDSLLETPKLDAPIELTRPNVMYTFADPTLEARPAGQKLLLRIGPDNAAVVRAKLGELRAIITAAPPAH